MTTLGITRFEDLISHMDGLADSARRSHVDAETVDFLVTIRHRLVRIHNHLTGQPAEAEPGTHAQSKSVTDTEDLLNQFGMLTDAARGAGLPSALTHYLHTARLRMRFSLRGQAGRRIVNRDEKTGTAELEWPGGRETVEVVDSSAYGAGVIGRNPIAVSTVARLTTQEEARRRRYECLVVYCEQNRFEYHIGLEVFAIL
ncbi:hypothetical protein [Thiohalorhabdus methylotrophus]|uniref:PilZ domain-containing protein n=1 Tax=Thiohalorhabdus methylotrophus TaxID=3242694 RepID=A0ABV4TSH0_9GAMM